MRTRWRRLGAAFGAVILPVTLGTVGIASAAPGTAGTGGVPAKFRPALAEAAYTCPHLPAGLQAALIQVESGYDALKKGPNEVAGLAQLSPRMWSAWGADADGDGLNSPLDSADAIDTQARLLCHYYRTAVASDLSGDRISLALAAYRLGWNRVVAARGLARLPATRAYIAEVKALTPRYADGLGVTPKARSMWIPRSNPRSVSAAIAWARSEVGDYGWEQLCLNFTAQAYGYDNSGVRYAIDHWLQAPPSLRHHRVRSAPAGSLMYWDTGRRAGHVAISLGDGYVVSNDINAVGRISIVPASTIDQRWNARYLGWTPPYYPMGS